jgi:hypothetical protein
MQIGCSSRQSLYSCCGKRWRGGLACVFGPDFGGSHRGSGGVDSGYACGGLVPMWESGGGCGLCAVLAVRAKAPAARVVGFAPFGRSHELHLVPPLKPLPTLVIFAPGKPNCSPASQLYRSGLIRAASRVRGRSIGWRFACGLLTSSRWDREPLRSGFSGWRLPSS